MLLSKENQAAGSALQLHNSRWQNNICFPFFYWNMFKSTRAPGHFVILKKASTHSVSHPQQSFSQNKEGQIKKVKSENELTGSMSILFMSL